MREITDEVQVVVTNQDTRQQARLAQDLEAVADPEDEAACMAACEAYPTGDGSDSLACRLHQLTLPPDDHVHVRLLKELGGERRVVAPQNRQSFGQDLSHAVEHRECLVGVGGHHWIEENQTTSPTGVGLDGISSITS